MKLVFAYERLDGQYGVCWIDENSAAYQEIESTSVISVDSERIFSLSREASLDTPKCAERCECFCEYSCKDVQYIQKKGEAWVKLEKKEEKKVVEIAVSLFNDNIVCVENSVTITNVKEYINCIEHIRLVSLAEHIKALLQYDLRQNDASTNKESAANYIVQLQYGIKDANDNIIRKKEGLSEYKAEKENGAILKTINEIINSQEKPFLSESTIYEIKRSYARYKLGAIFGYYRGIGHTIYPDIPSIFRDQYKREEDRWYREMKAQFQKDLAQKPYLDRLGMLQHYELPTRMLDVTSSPLVALYMTSNTIYTGDPEQTDMGEVVVYYDGVVDRLDGTNNMNAVSLDSYGSDIAYIHDGKSYDSSIVLVLAALAKLKYENKERMRRVIVTLRHLLDLTWSMTPRKYLSAMELINRCFHANADCFEQHYYFTKDEVDCIQATYVDCLQGKELRCAEDVCDILWEIADADKRTASPSGIYTSKEELHNEYLHCILSYRYILSTVRRENPAFKDHINIFDLVKCFHVKMGRTNDRIQAQAGSFIICGLDPEYIKNCMLSSRTPGMVRFFVKNKKEIMRELNSLDINDATMLPDMAHHAQYLKSRTKN